MLVKSYRAYGNECSVIALTPKEAAQNFFEKFPTKRKCNITEGIQDGHFFTVSYGRLSEGKCPQSWKNVTKKMMAELPSVGA